MRKFENEGHAIAFIDEGPREGDPVLLIHGFASNMRVNWIDPGWVEALSKGGYRVLAFDHRGHGDSDKPREAASYRPERMASDALALLDHAGIGTAVFFGYSMGARVSAFAALAAPERVRALVFGGLGMGLVQGVGDWDPIADALLAPSLDDVSNPRGRMFRAFADRTRSDRHALAACITASRAELTPEQVGSLRQPTLVGVGTKDDLAGSAEKLAALLPDGKAFAIEGRDHMLAVGDRTFKAEVLHFLQGLERA